MLGQSKTVFQAEIDAACELVDFWRFNPFYAQELYQEQPLSDHSMWNQLEYRPLEGFVYAVTPFNFTSIGGNLPTAPALMGATVIWKPASSAMLSAYTIVRLLEAAGLPPGVINFVPGDAAMVSEVALGHRDLAGVHFTGSTAVFNSMWKTIGAGMSRYRSYPRIRRCAGPGRGHRPGRVRVPGPEVLGGEPRLRAALDLARRARADGGHHARDADGRRGRLPELHGGRHRRPRLREDRRVPGGG